MIRISFLITHYNRPEALRTCIESIKDVKSKNDEIIVSDDASCDQVLHEIQLLDYDKLIQSNMNQGLAANINKGIRACNGAFIIYCQEDFTLDKKLKSKLPYFINVIEKGSIDMIRFSSYVFFNKLEPFCEHLSIIPKFRWQNFLQNFYRYSDHPFFIKNDFYNRFGVYMENTSGRYGETEYGVRLSNSKAIIAITRESMAYLMEGNVSTLASELPQSKVNRLTGKKLAKFIRAMRIYFEWAMYRNNKRGLITYKNARQQ